MKIVQVAMPTIAGGAERVIESLAVGHHRRGHDVTCATILPGQEGPHPFIDSLENEGVPVYPIRLATRDYLGERRVLGDLMRELKPDIAHLHGYRIELLDRGVIARAGVPTVTTVHGVSKMGGLKGVVFEWLQRRNYLKFDAVAACSGPLLEETRSGGVPEDRLHMIPNAWSGLLQPLPRAEARARLGLADDGRPVIGWVGRLIHVKAGDVFLRALAALPEPRPVAVMIGYGGEGENLQMLRSELGLDNDVRFEPEIRDAGRYFGAFDSYVLSSRSEGLPIVVLEAMAAGVPIVATTVGGVPDVIGPDDPWLVPPNDPQALSRAIGASLSDESARAAQVARLTARLEQDFSLDTFLDRYEEMYREVLARR